MESYNKVNFINAMSGFTLHEYSIAVDVFNVKADVYLLTHCHTDHLVGLGLAFQGVVYCTEVTRKLLLLNVNFNRFTSNLQSVEVDVPFRVKVGCEYVTITPIDSYHCPGSCMFLIEGDSNVLVTGDIRAEAWWTQTLVKHVRLFPYATGGKVLHNIYLDTTFGYRGEPFIEMIPNSEGIAAVIKLLQMYPQDPDISVTFPDHVLGFEEAWTQILALVEASVHACSKVESRNNVLPAHLRVARSHQHGLDVHICSHDCASSSKFNVTVRQCINFNIIDYVNSLLPVNVKFAENWEVLDTTCKGHDIVKYRNRIWIHVGDLLLPKDIKLVFSRHSSYTESKQFVQLFRPVQVYPCGSPSSLWKNGFVMSRLFGDVCQLNNPGNFIYDVWMSVKMKFPNHEVMQRPVVTINRWDANQCENEFQFVYKALNKGVDLARDFNFFGIPLQPDVVPETIQLSKYICNANDSKIMSLIKKSEYLYRQYILHGLPGQRPTNRDYLQEINQLEQQYADSYLSEDETYGCSRRSSRRSSGSSSAAAAAASTTTATFVDEFGTAAPSVTPSLNSATKITSLFDSWEHSFTRKSPDALPDTATIRRITTKLQRDPDEYFNFNLRCLNQFSLH